MAAAPGTDSAQSASLRPQSILFACTFNSVRSPMAEGLGRRLFGRDIYFASVGVRGGEADPFAIAAMEEIGIDIADHVSIGFDDLDDTSFDLIITLSPEAHHAALEFTRNLATRVIYWPTLDPTAVQGARETILDAYRGVRDGLQQRIKEFLGWHPVGST
ncbi:MAG TPA: arsenate reductase ArsC [Beijerinckiaceae bacterium]|nr:arsenate reductase ArsC [Beijerinckiaceae bacterium]